MENLALSRKDFRDFNDSDWMGFQGAECPDDGVPLIHEPGDQKYSDLVCIVLCDNLIGFHYFVMSDNPAADYYDVTDKEGEMVTWQMEVENQQQGLEIISMMRVPTELPMIEESKALRKLGFETA